MKKVQCPNCGAQAHQKRGNWPLDDWGVKGAMLLGTEIIRCAACGEEMPIIRGANRIQRTLAEAIVRKPYRLAGDEVRFLRKYIGVTQDEFARLLHVDKTTISKWETGDDPVGIQSDLLIRAIAMLRHQHLIPSPGETLPFLERLESIREQRKRVRVQIDPETFSYAYA
jgi:putative zinc finger/helix-turn-helix YgiT family protein